MLSRLRILNAPPGSYTLTGAATTALLIKRKLAATAGSYVLTGTAATMLIEIIPPKVLAAAPGSYLLTGRPSTQLVFTLLVLAPAAHQPADDVAACYRGGAGGHRSRSRSRVRYRYRHSSGHRCRASRPRSW